MSVRSAGLHSSAALARQDGRARPSGRLRRREGEESLRTDVDHLPDAVRAELTFALRVLLEEFAATLGQRPTQAHRRDAAILKVILFGSFARGDWVDDRVGGYRSDYDLLVVVNDERLADVHDHWEGAAERFVRELTVTGALTRPVNFIVHSLRDLNAQLERGRPFFLDLVQDGVVLLDTADTPLRAPRRLAPEEARREAQLSFEEWFPSATDFLDQAHYAADHNRIKVSAFELHQATERFYHCVLLVLTLYSPKSHKLDVLRSLAEDLAPRLRAAWPRDDRASRRGFDRIRRAYVEARYSPRYSISPDELAFALARISVLQTLVREVCRERLADLDGPVERGGPGRMRRIRPISE